jgi:hypothetical protein
MSQIELLLTGAERLSMRASAKLLIASVCACVEIDPGAHINRGGFLRLHFRSIALRPNLTNLVCLISDGDQGGPKVIEIIYSNLVLMMMTKNFQFKTIAAPEL